MELMDKALGELLRRLPIIIVEDSSLHPDFALVVWMMVAHSKGFFFTDDKDNYPTPAHSQLILALQLRVLRIIYQVASCPVQDMLGRDVLQTDHPQPQPCLTEPFLDAEKPKDMQLNIWAMLLRAQYGGMACDVAMLKGFAQIWRNRLYEPVPDPVGAKSWSEVPAHLHSAGTKQSMTRVPKTAGLPKLSLNDVCKEGVDFHCSNLVNALLGDPTISAESQAMANQLNTSTKELLLKRCIWKFSAGVNLRRPLIPEPPKELSQTSIVEEPLKDFWKTYLVAPVVAYQTKYVQGRI